MKRNGNAKRFGLVWVFVLVCGVVLVLMCCQEMMAEEPADGPGTDGTPPAAGSKTPATAAEAVPLDQEEEDAEEEEDEAADEDEDEEDDEDDEYDREEAEGRRIKAEQGDAEAQYTLGGYYEGGLGVERNLSEAVKWYRKAAEQGYVDAQIALGECYYDGDGVEKNRAEAVKWWRKAAEKEELPAFYAAECDESKSKKDEDVGDDLPETVRKFLPAAKGGDVDAQIALGEYYEKRFDGGSMNVMLMTEKDYKEREKMIRDLAKTFDLKAFRWYRKAAEQGSAKAQFKVGDYYIGGGSWVVASFLPKIKWYLKAAEQGYTPAMVELAMCSSYMGSANKPAFQWYREAAELGDATAQFALGKCYEDGDGVVQNLTKAIEWYRKAAEQGNGKAQFALGLCYEGDRVEQNLAEAVKWYQKTAENEDTGGEASEAMYHLALCYENGKGVEKDLTKAFKLYKRSVESVYFTADFWKDVAYHLARCYENGIGVEKDLTKAIEWYRRAAERGSHEAKDALKRLGK